MLELEYKPDFEATRRRWATFWDGTNTRPLVRIVLPKPGLQAVDSPAYLAEFDGDFTPIIDQLLAWAETHEFLGEAIPFYYVEFGPDTFAAYLGAQLILSNDRTTSWSVPFVEDWDQTEIRFHRNGYWWQRTIDFIHALRRRCDGKLLVCPPTLVANLDALAAIRGPQNLLMDLALYPEKVERALADVCTVHSEVMDAYARELDWETFGSINLEGFYVAGRQSRPQCDMSCMIGPAMFERFVVPALQSEADDADAFVYHLDGPGAIRHVEALCALEKLDLISWVPGAGNEEKDWNPLYERIDRLGKGHCRRLESHAIIKYLWQTFESRKLVFSTTASSRAEAEDFLLELEELDKSGDSNNEPPSLPAQESNR